MGIPVVPLGAKEKDLCGWAQVVSGGGKSAGSRMQVRSRLASQVFDGSVPFKGASLYESFQIPTKCVLPESYPLLVGNGVMNG